MDLKYRFLYIGDNTMPEKPQFKPQPIKSCSIYLFSLFLPTRIKIKKIAKDQQPNSHTQRLLRLFSDNSHRVWGWTGQFGIFFSDDFTKNGDRRGLFYRYSFFGALASSSINRNWRINRALSHSNLLIS